MIITCPILSIQFFFYIKCWTSALRTMKMHTFMLNNKRDTQKKHIFQFTTSISLGSINPHRSIHTGNHFVFLTGSSFSQFTKNTGNIASNLSPIKT